MYASVIVTISLILVVQDDDDPEGSYSPNIDTSDDYVPSETETESSNGEDYEDDRGALDIDGHPTFVISLNRTNLNRTIEIPYEFWKRHTSMATLKAPIYLVSCGRRRDMDNVTQTQRECEEATGEARVVSFQK